jgi:serine/threonine-protein kinase
VIEESPGQASLPLAGPAPGSVVGGYRIESRLGAGGMAVVYRARDQGLDRIVALKVLAPGLADDAEFRERFIRESRAAARVDHPHIIPVHGAGESDGVLYLAMRFVPGGDLRSVIAREGPLSGERAAFLLSPVASALDAAHAAGLVHRDVKPANVLIDTSPGRPDHPYLSDFGLAKGTASAAGLTGTGQFLGTPDYAAPEQISGKPTGPRADQYALACVAFTALTGATPFARGTSLAVLWAHVYDSPPLVQARRRDLPAAVDSVLARALAKAPEERYQSCGEFTDALRAALGLHAYARSRPGVTGGAGPATSAGASALDAPAGAGSPPPPLLPFLGPTPTQTAAPPAAFAPAAHQGPPQWYMPSEPAPPPVAAAAGSRSPAAQPAGSGLPAAPPTGPRSPAAPPKGSRSPAPRGAGPGRLARDQSLRARYSAAVSALGRLPAGRRRLLAGGGVAGAAVAATVIALLAASTGNPPSSPAAARAPATRPAAAPSPTRSPARSGAASPATSPGGSLLTDEQAGLTYAQLAPPWQGVACPGSLNNGVFQWTAGEYAVAGQVNGGSLTWYGEGCSGSLPAQYGYTGTAQLQVTTENLALTFENAYYNALDHTVSAELDQPVEVSGHAGWEVTYDVAYTNAAGQGVTWTGEQAAVTVVDNGTKHPAVFFASVPATLGEGTVTTLVESLRLARLPPAPSPARGQAGPGHFATKHSADDITGPDRLLRLWVHSRWA